MENDDLKYKVTRFARDNYSIPPLRFDKIINSYAYILIKLYIKLL